MDILTDLGIIFLHYNGRNIRDSPIKPNTDSDFSHFNFTFNTLRMDIELQEL